MHKQLTFNTYSYLLVSGTVMLELGDGVTLVVTVTVDRKTEQSLIKCSIP